MAPSASPNSAWHLRLSVRRPPLQPHQLTRTPLTTFLAHLELPDIPHFVVHLNVTIPSRWSSLESLLPKPESGPDFISVSHCCHCRFPHGSPGPQVYVPCVFLIICTHRTTKRSGAGQWVGEGCEPLWRRVFTLSLFHTICKARFVFLFFFWLVA